MLERLFKLDEEGWKRLKRGGGKLTRPLLIAETEDHGQHSEATSKDGRKRPQVSSEGEGDAGSTTVEETTAGPSDGEANSSSEPTPPWWTPIDKSWPAKLMTERDPSVPMSVASDPGKWCRGEPEGQRTGAGSEPVGWTTAVRTGRVRHGTREPGLR